MWMGQAKRTYMKGQQTPQAPGGSTQSSCRGKKKGREHAIFIVWRGTVRWLCAQCFCVCGVMHGGKGGDQKFSNTEKYLQFQYSCVAL
jgi:hypothetical protein